MYPSPRRNHFVRRAAPLVVACVLLNILLPLSKSSGAPIGTAFNYQGNLQSDGVPADGLFDFEFSLFDDAASGSQVGSTIPVDAVEVDDGRFVVLLDFGNSFGGARWLNIAVRTNGGAAGFTDLTPRQALTPTPFSIVASSLAGALDSSLLSGDYTDPVTISNQANMFAGSFSGDGADLTNLNADHITSGTLSNERLGPEIARFDLTALFADSVTAEGGFIGDGSNLTNLNADFVSTGTLADDRLTLNIPRLDQAPTFTGAVTADGGFIGDGSNLTNLNADFISTGTLADDRLTLNIPRLDQAPAFTGAVTALGFIGDGSTLTGLSANQIVAGKLGDGFLSPNVALLDSSPTFIGTVTANSFVGDGSGLTGVQATLPPTVARLPATQTFTGNSNTFTGPVFANKFVGDGSGLTGITADPFELPDNVALLDQDQTFDGRNTFNDRVAILSTGRPLEVTSLGGGSATLKAIADTNVGSGVIISLDASRINKGAEYQIQSTGTGSDEGPGKLIIINPVFPTTNNARALMTFSTNGFIGIGEDDPEQRLHVKGKVMAQSFIGDGAGLTNLNVQDVDLNNVAKLDADQSFAGANTFQKQILVSADASATPLLSLQGSNGSGDSKLFQMESAGGQYSANITEGGKFSLRDETHAAPRLTVRTNGYVGVNVDVPEALIHARRDGIANFLLENTEAGASIMTFQNLDYKYSWVLGESGDVLLRDESAMFPATRLVVDTDGNVGIGVSPQARLDVKSSFQITESSDLSLLMSFGTSSALIESSKRLKINATSGKDVEVPVLIVTGGADLAEPFNVSPPGESEVSPGMVVVIDPNNPGELKVATERYDRKVAGIVSGAGGVKPGMMLRHEGTMADGDHPIALTGRVYCYVDADTNGPVSPGDMLTTSNTPGHAMRVTDFDEADGAILGKAMTSLESGRGLVLVLVNLQ